MDKKAVELLALRIAEAGGQTGHHEERWYSKAQKDKFVKKARDILQLMSNDGFVLVRKADQ